MSAGELNSSNKEILSACFHYINENLELKEAFLKFIEIEYITGEDTGKTC